MQLLWQTARCWWSQGSQNQSQISTLHTEREMKIQHLPINTSPPSHLPWASPWNWLSAPDANCLALRRRWSWFLWRWTCTWGLSWALLPGALHQVQSWGKEWLEYSTTSLSKCAALTSHRYSARGLFLIQHPSGSSSFYGNMFFLAGSQKKAINLSKH